MFKNGVFIYKYETILSQAEKNTISIEITALTIMY